MPINSLTRRLSEIAAFLLSARIRREHRIKIFLGLYRHQPLIRPARWNEPLPDSTPRWQQSRASNKAPGRREPPTASLSHAESEAPADAEQESRTPSRPNQAREAAQDVVGRVVAR